MSATTEFLLVPLVFAALAVLSCRVLGRCGLIALAIGWVAVLSWYILASAPGPEVPLHDFEKTPVPALAGALAGTVAATGFLLTKGRKRPLPVRLLATAGVYLVVSLAADIVVLLLYLF